MILGQLGLPAGQWPASGSIESGRVNATLLNSTDQFVDFIPTPGGLNGYRRRSTPLEQNKFH